MASNQGLTTQARARIAGFTLLELMAVVTILAVLSMAAIASYRKYAQRGKNMEAIHMLSDIGMKQAMYFSLYGQYVDTTADDTKYVNTDFYPPTADIGGGQMEWEIACPQDAATYPGWCALGVRPSSTINYQYVTAGWAPNDATDAINTPDGKALITDATRQWWYAVARGDLDNNGVYKTFIFTSEVNEVFTIGLTE